MLNFQLFNGYQWITEKQITFDRYKKILSISKSNEGITWRVVL